MDPVRWLILAAGFFGRQACQPTRSTMMLGAMVGDTLAGKIDDDSFDEAYENLSEYERLW